MGFSATAGPSQWFATPDNKPPARAAAKTPDTTHTIRVRLKNRVIHRLLRVMECERRLTIAWESPLRHDRASYPFVGEVASAD